MVINCACLLLPDFEIAAFIISACNTKTYFDTSEQRSFSKVLSDNFLIIGEEVLNLQTANCQLYPAQPSLSKLRYWIASARCSIFMSSLMPRSATVRDTFKIRS